MSRLPKLLLPILAAVCVAAPSADAATTYSNPLYANWGLCTGFASMKNPYWGNVSGVAVVSCAKSATYEIRLTTGWNGFNDIYTTSVANVNGPFSNRVVTTDNRAMPLSVAPSFWACVQVWANVYGGGNMYPIANACGYYRK